MLFKWLKSKDSDSDVEKVTETTLADAQLKEKDLENIIAKKIDELVRTDQLMVILQERRMKEEPDILALDENGVLYIFELKRWEARGENLLQALRYGQKFGRYDYDKLNWFYQSYSHSKGEAISLDTAHRDFFGLEAAVPKERFNHEQQFVIVTNGLDYDTWDAIAYWKQKGIRMTPLVYRLFALNNDLFIDFDPYGPIPDAPKQLHGGLYVVNTNKTYMPDVYKDMVTMKKASAYYDKKYAVSGIGAGDLVCLYHVGVGVLGIGKAKTEYQECEIDGDAGEEYFVPIDFEFLVDITDEGWQSKAIHAWEINAQFNTGYRFRQTVFQLPAEFAKFIRAKFKEKGVKKPA